MSKDPAFLFYTSDFLTGTMMMTDEQVGKYIRLLCLQHQMGKLSEKHMLRICGEYDEDIFSKFALGEDGNYHNIRLDEESEKRNKYCESRRQSRRKADEDNVKIYLIKDNISTYTKIGSSVNPSRRFAEMCGQKNPAITIGEQRDYALIFESKIIERTVENKLHEKFANKRISGEWFNLSDMDISFIKSTYGCLDVKTYARRTSSRTENENENINENEIIIKDKKVITELFNQFYLNYPKKIAKQEAVKAFAKIELSKSLFAAIMASLDQWKKSDDWTKDAGQFIPYPATWLNGKRWDDEPPKAKLTNKSAPKYKPSNVGNFTGRDYTPSDYEGMYESVEVPHEPN